MSDKLQYANDILVQITPLRPVMVEMTECVTHYGVLITAVLIFSRILMAAANS